MLHEDDTNAGAVSIETIKKSGNAGREIAELLPGQEEAITIGRKEDAREAFDKLLASSAIIDRAQRRPDGGGAHHQNQHGQSNGRRPWGEMSP